MQKAAAIFHHPHPSRRRPLRYGFPPSPRWSRHLFDALCKPPQNPAPRSSFVTFHSLEADHYPLRGIEEVRYCTRSGTLVIIYMAFLSLLPLRRSTICTDRRLASERDTKHPFLATLFMVPSETIWAGLACRSIEVRIFFHECQVFLQLFHPCF